MEPTKVILVTPDWGNQTWTNLLSKMSTARVEIPSGTKIFVSHGQKIPLPAPSWNTHVSVVDSILRKISQDELDPKIVKFVQRCSKNWTIQDLNREMKFYPKLAQPTMDVEIQCEGMGEKKN